MNKNTVHFSRNDWPLCAENKPVFFGVGVFSPAISTELSKVNCSECIELAKTQTTYIVNVKDYLNASR